MSSHTIRIIVLRPACTHTRHVSGYQPILTDTIAIYEITLILITVICNHTQCHSVIEYSRTRRNIYILLTELYNYIYTIIIRVISDSHSEPNQQMSLSQSHKYVLEQY